MLLMVGVIMSGIIGIFNAISLSKYDISSTVVEHQPPRARQINAYVPKAINLFLKIKEFQFPLLFGHHLKFL